MSAERKLANATGLYMEGIRDGKAAEALEKYTGARYTQHSTGVADGKEGFLEFFLPFLERNPVRDIRVVRRLVDGSHVFVHVHQSLNEGEFFYVTADIFDTDADDKIVEHWDVIQEEVRQTKSGRSMVDGPTEIEDLDKTEENRALVTAFANEVLVGGRMDRVTEFISSEEYRQHNPHAADGLAGLADLVASFEEFRYVRVHKILAQGNFAVTLSHAVVDAADWCFIDIFRVQDGRIVEHWDVQEKILPQEQWNNSGKF